QAQVVNLLQDLQQRLGIAYIFIAHDLAVVRHIASHVAVMYLGRIVEFADKATLFEAPRHPYTQALLAAIPVPEPGASPPGSLLQGDVPSPLNPPPGCHFHTRCPHARAVCAEREPPPERHDRGMLACHRWREIAVPAARPEPPSTPAQQRLARLQSAFVR
ncbi:MAG: ABC transporter ATP-binding protein, partial [Rubrivivax sp.]|nr:ABC transporter ATP-binding protein [Rubrivivax sp.]